MCTVFANLQRVLVCVGGKLSPGAFLLALQSDLDIPVLLFLIALSFGVTPLSFSKEEV